MDDQSHLRATVNEDGAAILDTRRRTISTLNPTGAYVWLALERGEDIETIAQNLAHNAGEPVDTVKQVERTAEGAIIKATIPREKIVLAQTPQGFRYEVLKKAFDEAAADGFVGTDEASLVERSGHQVAVVMGSPRNMKITTPADLELAEFYSRQGPK